MSIKQGMPGRQRRRHSAEFKAKLIEECRRPGVSMASVAMANGVNPNLLRRPALTSNPSGAPPSRCVPRLLTEDSYFMLAAAAALWLPAYP